MTPKEQNAAIAKLMGKTPSCGRMVDDPHIWGDWIHQSGSLPITYRKCSLCPAIHMQGERFVSIGDGNECPNYLEDLNAMHEAEKLLSDKMLYIYWIDMIQKSTHLNIDWNKVHVASAVRAEAFLRAKGLWRETATEPTVSKP